MTDHEPAAGDGVGESGTECKACGKPEHCSLLLPKPPDKDNKHVVRIVGTYSLFTFFKEEGQRVFFETITGEEFETTFKPKEPNEPKPEYAWCIEPFHLDAEEKRFELRMTNMGFIREAFWKEAFPPIFRLNGDSKDEQTWERMLPGCTKVELDRAIEDLRSDKHAEAQFYQYCLRKLADELNKAVGQQEIHIGLNRFGIVNIGITIKWDDEVIRSFEDLCKHAYTSVSHLQEDPLKDCKAQWTNNGTRKDPVITALEQCEEPRLLAVC